MAYNLQSLISVIDQILNPDQTRWIVDHNKPKLQSLLEKAARLQQILEKSPLTNIESLESQIRDAANKAEDIIESHMVDQMLSRHRRRRFSRPRSRRSAFVTPDLRQVTQELDSAIEQVEKLVEGKTASSGSSSSGMSFLSSRSVVVGVDADLMQLKDRLVGMQSKLEVVPIVGMGGIGKTTLARKLYEDKLIVSRFEYRGWTTISQDYNMRAILLGLLRCITGNELDKYNEKGDNELKDVLYQSLYSRRYLIVLDDMWSSSSWDEIRMYFPDNNNGSRIVLTTRESDMAKHANSLSVQHQMQFLSESTSWDLLRQIVFGEEGCPDFLRWIGEKIARDCGGLPLAIRVIGGILSKVERSRVVWENIAKDVRVAIVESDEKFPKILSLSYDHLPNHLKPCFLYMGAYPEDEQIETSRLVLMWIAEGFVKSNGDKSLEEEAEDYLKALVERNLLLVKDEEWNGKLMWCAIHDLLRDLCMRKAYEDKFLHVKNSPNVRSNIYDLLREADEDKLPQFSNSRRVSVHISCGVGDVYASPYKLMSLSLARSFLVLSTEHHDMFQSSFFSVLRLVTVLDVMVVIFIEFPPEILQLVNLRFLAINCISSIPSGISKLWNLQTLIALVDSDDSLPFEIWQLSELRHLELVDGVIWFEDEYMKQIVHKKVQMIFLVALCRSLIRNAFLEGIPNIKDLGIWYLDRLKLSGIDLSRLHKLESLRCQSVYVGSSRRFWSTLKFPFGLKKLNLYRIAIFPRVSTLLCALPNLEVLEIRYCGLRRKDEELEAPDQAWEAAEEDAILEDEEMDEEVEAAEDEEWEVAEGDEFRSLQFLCIGNLKLKRWRADQTNFPILRHLHLILCEELEEIPSSIGEIPTLQLIKLDYCSGSVVASAKQIEEVQQSEYGNYDLKLRIS